GVPGGVDRGAAPVRAAHGPRRPGVRRRAGLAARLALLHPGRDSGGVTRAGERARPARSGARPLGWIPALRPGQRLRPARHLHRFAWRRLRGGSDGHRSEERTPLRGARASGTWLPYLPEVRAALSRRPAFAAPRWRACSLLPVAARAIVARGPLRPYAGLGAPHATGGASDRPAAAWPGGRAGGWHEADAAEPRPGGVHRDDAARHPGRGLPL